MSVVFVASRVFLLLQQVGVPRCGVQASDCRGFSPCRALAGLAVVCAGVVAPWHVGSFQIGIKPVSPALADRSLSTPPPGKSYSSILNTQISTTTMLGV